MSAPGQSQLSIDTRANLGVHRGHENDATDGSASRRARLGWPSLGRPERLTEPLRQSWGSANPWAGRVDNAAAEAFFSSLEWEVLSRNQFRDTVQAQAVVIDWCYTFYNYQRRPSAVDGLSPVNYEIRENRQKPEAA